MSGSRQERAVRMADRALWASAVLAAAGLGFLLVLRFRAPPLVYSSPDAQPEAIGAAGSATTGEVGVASTAMAVTDTLGAVPPESAGPAASPLPPAADVVLLPCSEPNPRADGSFLIPPHDPTRHTVVGLPSGPGEPKRGLLIPPHDPASENRIPVQLVPLDSLLAHTIRIPPHNPERFKLARLDTLPCLSP